MTRSHLLALAAGFALTITAATAPAQEPPRLPGFQNQ